MFSFRRAAIRVLSSSTTATPVQSTRSVYTAFNRSPSVFARHPLQQSVFQSRWYSDEISRQRQTELNENKNEEDVVEEVEAEFNATRASETPGHESFAETDLATETRETGAAKPNPFRFVEQPVPPKETVYISNLFYDITADDLRKQMEQFGVVKNVAIIHDSRGLSKGFGYVTFDSIQAATDSINAMHREMYEGRPAIVQYARSNTVQHTLTRSPKMPPSRTLYVGKIPDQMTAPELHALFDELDGVIDVRVSVDRRTGLLRGFAHAEFANVDSAKAGFEYLSTKEVHGRYLRLDYSDTKRVGNRGGKQASLREAPVFSGPSS